MTQPEINIKNITKTKISDELSMDKSEFDISCNQDIIDFEVRALNKSQSGRSGIIVEKAPILNCSNMLICGEETVKDWSVSSNTDVHAVVDWDELQGDGNYVIKTFVKTKDGVWHG